MSDWVLDELERLARLPSEEELLEHLRRAEPFVMKQSSSTLLRKDRDAASSRQLLDAALVTTDERQSHTPRLGIEVIVP